MNSNGTWADGGEHVFSNVSLTAGSNSLVINVPPSAVNGFTYARFRFTSTTVTSPSYMGS